MTQTMESPAQVPARQISNGNSLARRLSAFDAMADRFGMERSSVLALLKATCLRTKDRDATDAEATAFAIVANQYGLNPFTKEIHAFADKGRIVPIVGIDGWSHIVNAHPQFDGVEFLEVESEDGREPVRTTCTMYVKERAHPVVITERFSECKRPTDPWRQMPFRMLRHKAFIQAARIAFSISGIHDEDEARDIIEGSIVTSQTLPLVSRTDALTQRLTSRPVSEGQTFEPNPDAAQPAQEQPTEPFDPATGEVLDPAAEPSTVATEAPATMSALEQFQVECHEYAESVGAAKGAVDAWWTGHLVKIGMKGRAEEMTPAQFAAATAEFVKRFPAGK